MTYTLSVSINLTDDEGETRLAVTRDYALDDLSGIPSTMEHASRSVALGAEGVEKFGLNNIEDAA